VAEFIWSTCRRRSDDGFNWKLSAAVFLALEGAALSLLQPRVYKKSTDTMVESCARMFLLTVLMCIIYSDFINNLQTEGEAVRADSSYCTIYGKESCGAIGQCQWDMLNSECGAKIWDTALTKMGFVPHILFGLPGLMPLIVHRICQYCDAAADKRLRAANPTANTAPLPPEQGTTVVRVHYTRWVTGYPQHDWSNHAPVLTRSLRSVRTQAIFDTAPPFSRGGQAAAGHRGLPS
jgi:hypothetical protein